MNLALLTALISLQPGPGEVAHTFVYEADKDYKEVSVSGQFNNWNATANRMIKAADGRRWSATVNLQPSTYQYKFVRDGEWIADPKGKDVSDGNGNTNSLLILVPEDYKKLPGKTGDSVITETAVVYKKEVPFLNFDKGKLTFKIRVRAGDIGLIELRTGGKNLKMLRVGGDELVDYYEASMPWDKKAKVDYQFALIDGFTLRTLGPKGLTEHDRNNVYQLDPMTYKPFEVPAWVEKSVFYQIFPDRFDNGSAANDPKNKTPWTEVPTYSNRYGGDAAGLKRRMAYLQRLGVNAMYINPVMAAPSNHRYDPVDFYNIDPEFASNEEFIELTKAMDAGGIRVVLDQIFDHVGITFPPFVDVLKNQEKSEYKDWFFIKEYPVVVRPNPPYVGWWGTEYMPKVNLANPGVQKYLMESVDFWMARAKLSGWRLDVANEVPDWFWQAFRKRVKGIDPNAWIVGEVWYDANPWLKGDQWDASMNYPFRDTCMNFLATQKTTPTEFVNGLIKVHQLYAPQVSRNQLNLLSSHDTPRFITEAGGDRKRASMAAVVQFTWPGAPSVYYGEELGMEGAKDPDNRRGMRWDLTTPQNEILSLYTKLTHLRTKSDLLASGEPVALTQFDAKGVASYGRVHGGDFAAVVLNRGRTQFEGDIQLPANQAGKEFVDALTGLRMKADARARLRVVLSPVSALIGLNASNTHIKLVSDANAAAQKMVSIKEPLP